MNQKSLGYAINSKTIDERKAHISGSKYPIVEFTQKQGSTELLFEAYAPEINPPIINQAAASSGYFNVFPDLDGVVRWVPLIIKCGEEFLSPLSIQSLWHYLDMHGEVALSHLVEDLGRSRELVLMSVGWLAREGHIVLVAGENERKIALRK